MNPVNDPLQPLRAVPLLSDLSDAQLATIMAATRERRLGKGEVVFHKGDPPTGLFIVAGGAIKVACQSPEGGEKIIDVLGHGQAVGESALFLGSPYPFFAAALSEARLLHIDAAPLLELVTDSVTFAKRMLSHLAMRLHTILGDIEACSIQNPTQRVIGFLSEAGAAHAAPDQMITLPAAKHVFASRLGMTPEAFSRALRDLIDAGLIEVAKNRITLLDRERLGTFAP